MGDWDTVLNVHLRGAFLMTRAAQKHMIDQKFGRIVNLSSTSALGNRGQVNYSAAKAGLQGFTKTLAIELGKFGVTANAIAPGFIQTEMTKATAERIGIPFEQFIEGAAKAIPVQRVGQPEDIAQPRQLPRERRRRLRLRPGDLRRRRPDELTPPDRRHSSARRTGRTARTPYVSKATFTPESGVKVALLQFPGQWSVAGARRPSGARARAPASGTPPLTCRKATFPPIGGLRVAFLQRGTGAVPRAPTGHVQLRPAAHPGGRGP